MSKLLCAALRGHGPLQIRKRAGSERVALVLLGVAAFSAWEVFFALGAVRRADDESGNHRAHRWAGNAAGHASGCEWERAFLCPGIHREGRLVRASLADAKTEVPNKGSLEEKILEALPFQLDSSMIAQNVTYAGPLVSLHGKEAYLAAMRDWQADVPQRLERFEVLEQEVFTLQPGEITARWAIRFIAPLPPTARLRELPPALEILPGEKVEVQTRMRATMRLDAHGHIAQHEEEITAGFGIPDAIARYELLTARRRQADNPASWYWQVLRETTLEELAFYAGRGATREQLERQFYEMVLRNFAYGLAIGLVIWTVTRLLIYSTGLA